MHFTSSHHTVVTICFSVIVYFNFELFVKKNYFYVFIDRCVFICKLLLEIYVPICLRLFLYSERK